MPIDDPKEFMDATNDFLRKIEASSLVSRRELEAVRKDLVAQTRADGRETVKNLQTQRIGRTKIVIPNSENLRQARLLSERTRERFSNFRLSYLSPDQLQDLQDLTKTPADTRKFIRHSRRLAKHSREFLARLEELEPDLAEEIQEARLQLEDNDMDLLKLEIKSSTRMRETLVRALQGRKQKSQVLKEVESFDLNRNLWNLSLLEHPKASVRGLLANASERMGSRDTATISQLPKAAHVFVGIPPDAVTKLTPSSRTAKVAWRLFSNQEIDNTFKALPSVQKSATSWRGLGLAPNTQEWYLPVPPEIVPGVSLLASERRSAFLSSAISAAAVTQAARAATAVASAERAIDRAEDLEDDNA